MTLRELVVAFGFEVDKKSEKQAENSIKGLKSIATKLLGAIGIGFSIRGLSDLAQAAADVEALNSQFTQVFGDMEAKAEDSLKSVADEAGSNVNRIRSSFTQLASFAKTTGADASEALTIAERGMKAASDSAAFYDRSLEEVTASLQSFMKGNYANDAALGLSCTEVTRNAAANELYGKSFKDLSEYQKQLTLLKMVEDANKLSGALGQAARESDTWTNQLGNMKQGLKDLKANIGTLFLQHAIVALKFLIRQVERLNAFVKRLQPAVKRFTDTLGGAENVLKLLAVVASALVLALNWTKIVNGAKAFMKVISVIKNVFSVAGLKVMAVVGAIVLLFLVIDDIINFMKGNDSVIGTMFEKAGINSDEVREKIKQGWEDVKEVLGYLWDVLKTTGAEIFEPLKQWWLDNKDAILGFASFLFTAITNMIGPFVSAIAHAVGLITALLCGDMGKAGEYFMALWEDIKNFFLGIWEALPAGVREKITNVVTTIKDGIQEAIDWITSLPEQAIQWGADFINGLKEGILSGISGIVNAVEGVGEKIKSFLHFSVPDEGPLTDYESWMPDFMGGLARGISDNEGTVLDKVRSLAGGISSIMKAATARAATATASGIGSRTSNVTQNVNISNSYSGGSAETQKNVSKAMKKSAVDSTTQMARALAVARG